MLCPNIESFFVKGNSLNHVKSSANDLNLRIAITTEGLNLQKALLAQGKKFEAKIYNADITRYFDVEDY